MGAEAIKMGIIRDTKLFEMMEQNAPHIMDLKPGLIDEVLYEAVRHKADVLAQDEKESGLRATLNFGHTIGHGVEALLSPQVLHGESVSIGCVAEAELASRMGYL